MCEIEINKNLNETNDILAIQNRKELEEYGVRCINIMGSPGSGKTTFIEGVASVLGNVSVIQGDLESDIDAKRLQKLGIPAYQINTHSGCHLNSHMIKHALEHIKLNCRFLLIENVGNLVCPAGVDIGQHMNIVVSATTEGSDKPKKYPIIFHNADLVVLSKMDLADAVGFNEEQYVNDIKELSRAEIVKTTLKDADSYKIAAIAIEKHL